jgi:mannose-1-phosphate guanylyltransferase/mannose-6-phosphate isomerase
VALYPIILAGGTGSRLWPVSRSNHPKQYLDLLQQGQTLLQASISRACACSGLPPLVVASEQHRFLLKHQLAAMDVGEIDVLLEPAAKNTAAAVLAGCLYAFDQDPRAQVLVLPSDQYLPDTELFVESVKLGFHSLSVTEIALMAIKPTYPSVEFGYIKTSLGSKAVFDVCGFTEKPNLVTAQSYLESGDYLWNAGVVMAHAKHVIDVFKIKSPKLYQCVEQAFISRKQLYDFTLLGAEAQSCPSISFDYAVLEHTPNIKAVAFNGEWDDLGTWKSLLRRRKQLDLPAILSSGKKPAVFVGVDDLLIIDDDDLILVANQDSISELSAMADIIVKAKRLDLLDRLETYRPWGAFKVLAQGQNFLVKQLSVQPGAQISLQSHDYRSEHWVVVAGTATVELKGASTELSQGQAITVNNQEKHRLLNNTTQMLEVIEVQTGSYLNETDIVRYDDVYGRH